MNKKVVISFYEDNSYISIDEPPSIQLIFRRVLVTDWSLTQMEELLDIGEGFYLKLLEGEHLTFIDFYSLRGYNKEVVDFIKSIPSSSDTRIVNSGKFLYKILQESNGDTPLPRSRISIYQKSRFEQGASGFGENIINLTNNPLFLIVVGYFIEKALDYVIHQFFKKAKSYQTQQIILNAKKFYKNAAMMLNCNYSELQITEVRLKKTMNYFVCIRNINGEVFNAECRWNGEIIKIALKKTPINITK
ncbi:hypothetical protein [Clostridium minihomine]|uniref:hypothetical protein n=1 Tax=Clostridium minihomine TaxID=2045012 RepID=UPI000C792B6E|nr:hypothetical protein [Clostridium minihomine]